MSLRSVAPVALLAAAVALCGCARKPPEPAPITPPFVKVTHPRYQDVSDFEDFAGRTESVKVVELKSQVTGYLKKIYFEDGQDIKAGEPLFDIDDRIYKAELATANAALRSAQARREKAVADEARAREGFKTGVNAQADLDQAISDRGVAEADIGTAKAAIDKASVNLQFCRIAAPFDGRLSKRGIDPENLVEANKTSLTTIVRLDEVYATFDIDERTVMRVRRLIFKGEATSSRTQPLQVQLALADDDDFSLTGTVIFTDNQIDAGTGTLRARAIIQNPRLHTAPWYLLSPGQFVRVRVPIGPTRKAVVVPEKAIGSDQGTRYVFVVAASEGVDENGKPKTRYKVERRNLRVGQLYGQWRVVEDGGLAPTDTIIYEGLLRVRQGGQVDPKEVDPKELESPKPKEPAKEPANKPAPLPPPVPAGPAPRTKD
jgi:multidrug efflux system membrane fusion protein